MRAILLVALATVACSGPSSVFGGDAGPVPGVQVEAGSDALGAGGASVWGPPHESTVVPPPISGGTLAVSEDGKLAVAADPDRDRIHVIDLASWSKLATHKLSAHDEPGRVVLDNSGHAHVVLRGGGAIVSFGLTADATPTRRSVCAAPRGIAFSAPTNELHVACVGGELVSLPASGGETRRVVHLARDLRDVVVDGDQLVVTRFRSATLLYVGADGVVQTTRRPSKFVEGDASTAWRTIRVPGGGVAMLHQRTTPLPVPVTTGGYGDTSSAPSCPTPIVTSTVSRFGPDAPSSAPILRDVTLAVDLAIDAAKKNFVLAVPGNAARGDRASIAVIPFGPSSQFCELPAAYFLPARAEPISVAFEPSRSWLAQARQPSALHRADGTTLSLDTEDRGHTGHTIFHADAGGGLACASCHPEGGDDGVTWQFSSLGKRRTQSLRGGIIGSEPFHWSGDQKDLRALAHEVLGSRMKGPRLNDDEVRVLASFLQSIPNIAASKPTDLNRVERGRALFERADVGCSTCHGGARFMRPDSVSVGTGGVFQIPSLRGVALREPLMHDGCAATLYDRFFTCGGGDAHGHTSHLSLSQVTDLVGYLETL